ncbi:MAG: hypothetical protein ABJA90_10765, partial [Ginsengibacter sp.]
MYKKILPVILLFLFITALVFILKAFLKANGFDINFLLGGNVILFMLSLAGFLIQMKGLRSSNLNAFMRGIYSSLLLKMFIVVAAVFIYIFISGGSINKPSLFTCMALYFLYTAIEVKQLMKIAR